MSLNPKKKEINKTLLTPCRQVGLKRRSLNSSFNTGLASGNSPSPVRKEAFKTPQKTDAKPEITPTAERVQLETDPQPESPLAKKSKPNSRNKEESAENASSVVNELDYLNALSISQLDEEADKIKSSVEAKRQRVGHLETESKNAKQHDPEELNSLICKWRRSCQTALSELLDEYHQRGKNCTMPVLLHTLGIPLVLVKYSEVDNDFE